MLSCDCAAFSCTRSPHVPCTADMQYLTRTFAAAHCLSQSIFFHSFMYSLIHQPSIHASTHPSIHPFIHPSIQSSGSHSACRSTSSLRRTQQPSSGNSSGSSLSPPAVKVQLSQARPLMEAFLPSPSALPACVCHQQLTLHHYNHCMHAAQLFDVLVCHQQLTLHHYNHCMHACMQLSCLMSLSAVNS